RAAVLRRDRGEIVGWAKAAKRPCPPECLFQLSASGRSRPCITEPSGHRRSLAAVLPHADAASAMGDRQRKRWRPPPACALVLSPPYGAELKRTRREQVRCRTRTDALVSQPETGKISCVHLPCCGRLPHGACRKDNARGRPRLRPERGAWLEPCRRRSRASLRRYLHGDIAIGEGAAFDGEDFRIAVHRSATAVGENQPDAGQRLRRLVGGGFPGAARGGA